MKSDTPVIREADEKELSMMAECFAVLCNRPFVSFHQGVFSIAFAMRYSAEETRPVTAVALPFPVAILLRDMLDSQIKIALAMAEASTSPQH